MNVCHQQMKVIFGPLLSLGKRKFIALSADFSATTPTTHTYTHNKKNNIRKMVSKNQSTCQHSALTPIMPDQMFVHHPKLVHMTCLSLLPLILCLNIKYCLPYPINRVLQFVKLLCNDVYGVICLDLILTCKCNMNL